MGLKFEKRYPLVLALIASISVISLTFFQINIRISDSMLCSGITAGAIFAGFDATHKSLLLSMKSKTMEEIRHTSYYPLLIKYMNSNLTCSLFFVLLSFLGQAIYDQISNTPPQWVQFTLSYILSPVWVFVGIWMLASFYRVNKVFASLVRQEKTEQPG